MKVDYDSLKSSLLSMSSSSEMEEQAKLILNLMSTTNASDNLSMAAFVSFMDADLPYYGKYFYRFNENYLKVHGYISVVVSMFGIIANVLNIIVLTRKDMISSTNTILTGLAVADMIVMMSYLPFAFHNYVQRDLPDEEMFTYGWAVFVLIHMHVTIVFHTISTWLTVTLAIFRYIAVSYPAHNKKWCNLDRAKFAIASTYVVCALFCIPSYVTFSIRTDASPFGTHTYKVDFSYLSKAHGKALQNANFWVYGVLAKLIPCIALTGLSLGLVRVLYQADVRKRRLKNRVERDKTSDRTTKMLLSVLLLFLITEFPSGILALLTGILGRDFFENVYTNFAEFMDALALINSAINFILYCTMSRQFRDTFRKLFTPKILSKWIPVPTESNTTCATTCV